MTRAITVRQEEEIIAARLKMRVVDIDITSYETGGESITPAEIGLNGIYFPDFTCTENGYTYCWDEANNKIKAFTAPAAEAANTTDIGTLIARFYGY